MKKIISFSLWGQDNRYLTGAIRNADIATDLYDDWVCRYYIFQCVPSPVVMTLSNRTNVEIIRVPYVGDWRGLFNRFIAIDDKDVSTMIVRDTDSRLSERERLAVDAWLASNKALHIMRDHPWHKYPILGGMWGIKQGYLNKTMKNLIESFNVQNKYGTDYEFLANVLLPIFRNNKENNYLAHDEFFDGVNFPSQRQDLEFCGKVFNADETTIKEHEEVLRNWLLNNNKRRR